MNQSCPSCAAPLQTGAQVCKNCGLSLASLPPGSAHPVAGSSVTRKDERFILPTEVRLQKLDPDGALEKEERTIAHDLSRSGMRLLTSWSDLSEGDLVRVAEVGGDFNTGAIVRHVHRGSDQITRVGVEFLKKAPDRMVGTTTSLPRPRFSSVQSSIVPPRPVTPSLTSSSLSRPAFTKPPAVLPPPRVEIKPPASTPAAPLRSVESILEEIEMTKEAVRELVAAGDVWEALDRLTKIQALAEGTPEEQTIRILTFETQARVPTLVRAAQQNLEDLARNEPADVAVHAALGRLYRQVGLSARARVAFKQVLALDPDHREAGAALKLLSDVAKPR